MKQPFRIYHFLFLFLFFQSAYAEENPVVFSSESFLKKHEAAQPNGDKLIEYVRDSETVENWTKLIGYRYQQLPAIENDPRKAAAVMARIVMAKNPGTRPNVIVNKNGDEATVDFLMLAPDATYMELNIFKYAKSDDGNAVVSFQWAYRFQTSSLPPYKLIERASKWLVEVTAFDMSKVRSAFKQ